jgi:hypothetical protein
MTLACACNATFFAFRNSIFDSINLHAIFLPTKIGIKWPQKPHPVVGIGLMYKKQTEVMLPIWDTLDSYLKFKIHARAWFSNADFFHFTSPALTAISH